MDIIILPFFVFLEICKWIIILDIILSWLPLFGIQIIIPFFHAALKPVYDVVYKYLPVQFGGLDFSSFIILLVIQILEALILQKFPAIILNIPYIALF